jgi:hypothetical protein
MEVSLAIRSAQALLLPVVCAVGCTAVGGESAGSPPGSAAWYETASPEQIGNYFRTQCVASGYLPGTPEMAECIRREANAAKQSDVARAAAIAAATAGN